MQSKTEQKFKFEYPFKRLYPVSNHTSCFEHTQILHLPLSPMARYLAAGQHEYRRVKNLECKMLTERRRRNFYVVRKSTFPNLLLSINLTKVRTLYQSSLHMHFRNVLRVD